MSPMPSGGRAAGSSLETWDSVHPAERPTRSFLTDEGRQLLTDLHARAACRDLGPAMFYPDKGVSGETAYAVCSTCAVRVECLVFALRSTERLGIWGQTGEKRRRPLLRRVAAGERPEDVAAGFVPPPVRCEETA